MKTLNLDKGIWYLPGPNYLYDEDVKALAAVHGLRIVDANVTASRANACEFPPSVRLKPEFGGSRDELPESQPLPEPAIQSPVSPAEPEARPRLKAAPGKKSK